MKKFALALMAASAAVFGTSLVASAYDPALVVEPASPPAGTAYEVTYENCFVGETITFTQADSTPTSVDGLCEPVATVAGSLIGVLLPQQAAQGNAVGQFTNAPTEGGTYNGTAVGNQGSPELGFQFTIEAGDEDVTTTTAAAGGSVIPTTGSSGVNTMTGISIALLVIGLGLFAVAQVRRRQGVA